MSTARNRDYSSLPQGIHNVAGLYGWNPTLIITGAQNPQTGAWSALLADSNGMLVVSLCSGSNAIAENRLGVLGGTGVVTGLALNENPARSELFIQATSTVTPVFVRYGSPASSQAFSAILNPSNVSGQAGGSLSSDKWRGSVYTSGGSYTAWEI
jgi:hypothetical protein